jgi:hypothetical protein
VNLTTLWSGPQNWSNAFDGLLPGKVKKARHVHNLGTSEFAVVMKLRDLGTG